MTSSRREFLHDVRDHRMTIRQDEDIYRHLVFARPDSLNRRFSLITWPGYLTICGDCDDFMFSRLRDMFEFFRFAGPDYEKSDRVNTGYWAGKCTSAAPRGGIMTFSEDLYREAIIRNFRDFSEGWPVADKRGLWTDVRDTLLDPGPDNEYDAISATISFRCPVSGHHPFQDFWDTTLVEPAFGFVWACHAIQWGIKQYDLHHQGRTQAHHDAAVMTGQR